MHLSIEGPSPAPLRLPLVWHDARGDAHADLLEVGAGPAARTLEDALVVELAPAWATLRELTPAQAGEVTFDGEKAIAKEPVYLQKPFQRDPDFAAVSVNYELRELQERDLL